MKSQPMMPMPDPEYQAGADAETLGNAHEIVSNKKRHGAAKAHAKKKAQKYQAIASEDRELVNHVKGTMKRGY